MKGRGAEEGEKGSGEGGEEGQRGKEGGGRKGRQGEAGRDGEGLPPQPSHPTVRRPGGLLGPEQVQEQVQRDKQEVGGRQPRVVATKHQTASHRPTPAWEGTQDPWDLPTDRSILAVHGGQREAHQGPGPVGRTTCSARRGLVHTTLWTPQEVRALEAMSPVT